MADKSVITNIEARVRQLIDDHKRLSDLCAELTAQRDTLRSEKNGRKAGEEDDGINETKKWQNRQ